MKVLLLLTLVAAAAVTGRRSDCDPLVPGMCVAPFPNNFYTRADATTDTGLRVDYGLDSFPKDRSGKGMDPYEWNSFDGHSPFPMIFAYFEEGVDVTPEDVPHHWDLESALRANASTVLLDTVTGERVVHWSELDHWNDAPAGRQMFLMHPAARLEDGRTYIVAFRNLLSLARPGVVLPTSPAFAALRDGTASGDPDVEDRRAHYEESIFPQLEAAGLARSSLQLAWEFTTASKRSMTERMGPMRDDALTNHLPAGGPDFTVKRVEDDFNEHIFRKLTVDIEVPLYMDRDGPGGRLVLDAAGIPVYQQQAQYEVTILIPRTLVDDPRPALIMQYGHGLFGSKGEVESGYLAENANRYGYILLAGDWWGMSTPDAVAVVVMMLTDLSDIGILPDRIQQGLVAKIFAVEAMTSSMLGNDLFTFGGVDVLEDATTGYFGNSQGGILGVNLMAVHTKITKGVLGVPGCGYSLLLPRSADWVPYSVPMQLRYADPLDHAALIILMSTAWERGEPNGFVSYITENLIPNTPSHNVIFHPALADTEVSWLSAYNCARSCKSFQFENAVRETNETLYGFPFASGTIAAGNNAIQAYDYQLPPAPRDNTPPTGPNPHSRPRREEAAWAQMDIFFRGSSDGSIPAGTIVDFCDPEIGCVRDY